LSWSRLSRPRRRLAIALLAVALVPLAWWLFGERGSGGIKAPPQLPIPVRVATARLEDMEVHLNALGTVTPLNTVTVRSRVDGELINIAFTEGETVAAGALLAEIDPRPYQAELDQAEGQQQQNLALLQNAESNLRTYQELWQQDSIARQQLDNQEALVRQYRGTLKIDQAQVDNARLQLSFTRIRAPIAGRVGLRKVDPGNLISSTDAEGLVVITQMNPTAVLFSLPEAELPAVLAALAGPERPAVEAWSRDGTLLLATGALRTLDNQIDTGTGTIGLKAEFTNADQRLFPNQFVNVRLRLRTLHDATVIPVAAVQYGAPGTYVYLVDERQRIAIRHVELGPGNGVQVAVAQGLTPGERVVVEGLDRLREGSAVTVVEAAPAAGQLQGEISQAERAGSPKAPAATRGA
jgi:multidrug efflux system membrane fusion protein